MSRIIFVVLLLIAQIGHAQVDDVLVSLRPMRGVAGGPTVTFQYAPLANLSQTSTSIGVSVESSPTAANTLYGRLIPGADYVYTFTVTYASPPAPAGQNFGPGIGLLSVNATAPLGYKFVLDGSSREKTYFYPGQTWLSVGGTVYTVQGHMKVVPVSGETGLRAGMATSLSVSGPRWRLSLGSLSNGQPAGSLVLYQRPGATTFLGELYTPPSTYFPSGVLNFVCEGGSREVRVIQNGPVPTATPNPIDTSIRQIIAPQVCVDITRVSSTSVRLDCYHRSQAIAPAGLPSSPNGTYNDSSPASVLAYTFGGASPFASYTVAANTLSADSLTVSGTIRDTTTTTVGAIARTLTTSLTRTGTSPNFTLTAKSWYAGTTANVVTTRVTSSSGENTSVADQNGTVAEKSSIVYIGGSGVLAHEPATESHGASSPVVRSFSYYSTDPFNGKVKTIATSFNGVTYGWQGFEYDSDGIIKNTHSPFKASDTSVPATFPVHSGVISARSRSPDSLLKWFDRVRETKTTISSVVTKWTKTDYTEPDYTINQSVGAPAPGLFTPPIAGGSSAAFPYASSSNGNDPYLGLVTAVQHDYNSSTTSLDTTTKYFYEAVGTISTAPKYDDFFSGLPYSVRHPDGTQESYMYERGSCSGTTFTANASPLYVATALWYTAPTDATRTTVIRGLYSATGNSTLFNRSGSLPIDPVNVVPGKSTMSVTIRDAYARVIRTESSVWSSGVWNLVSWTNYTYNLANQLISRVNGAGSNSTGVTSYSATYSGERLASETPETGIKTDYSYEDGSDRALTKTTAGVTTTYSYDGMGHVVTELVSGTVAADGTLTTSRTYDTLGRLTTESFPGRGTVSHAYSPDIGAHTISLPSGATRVETAYPDGEPKSVTGTSVVGQYFDYGVESDGTRYTVQSTGSSSSVRWKKRWTDWLGREGNSTAPDPSVLGQTGTGGAGTVVTTQKFYDAAGHLIKTTESGKSATLYQYDELSQLKREGLDVDNDGILTLGSKDRITDFDQYAEKIGADWWHTKQTTIYPVNNNSSGYVSSIVRQRATGFTGTLIEETNTTDQEGNVSTRMVSLSGSTETIVTTAPAAQNSSTETKVDGFTTSITDFDGLTTQYAYDSLKRTSAITDKRGNITHNYYVTNASLLQSVVDAAGDTTSYTYDTAGRRTSITDPLGQISYADYTLQDQILHQWGSGCYPVAYTYDPTYGEKTAITTFRSANLPAWSGLTWPASLPVVGDVTTFAYDAASGVLTGRTDATNKSVQYTYTKLRQTATLTNARGVIATYAYDPSTAELTGVSYTDSTPAVGYTYTRLGSFATVTDAIGLRTFTYDPTYPWRLSQEQFPTYYGSRAITTSYEGSTGAGVPNSYGPYTPFYVKGRARGYTLGTLSTPSADQQITMFRTGDLRLVGVNVGPNMDFVYSFGSGGLISGYTRSGSGFAANRSYEPQRDLVSEVKTSIAGSPAAQFDYLYLANGECHSAQMSGSAFADYGTSVYRTFDYDSRGELQTAALYQGSAPPITGTPISADELPGRRFAFRYDDIGNRKTAGITGDASADDVYAPNALNQYDNKENNIVRITGTVATNAQVAATSTNASDVLVNKTGSAFGVILVPKNTAGPIGGSATIVGAIPGSGGSGDIYSQGAHSWSAGAALQSFFYDFDGNLTSDGLKTYSYDAENRLTRIVPTSAAAAAGFPNFTIDFMYDYLGRRVQKTVTSVSTGAVTTTRFIYSGWNVVAELSGDGSTTLRSFIWGPDMTGSLSATGGIGALLQLSDVSLGKVLLPAYDNNGNVVALVNVNGALEASYEYGPYGELLRAQGTYAKTNPYRFSTKWQDGETDLIYYGHRYYTAALGRFINRDPVAEEGGLNLYAFTANDPISRWDFLGNVSPGNSVNQQSGQLLFGQDENNRNNPATTNTSISATTGEIVSNDGTGATAAVGERSSGATNEATRTAVGGGGTLAENSSLPQDGVFRGKLTYQTTHVDLEAAKSNLENGAAPNSGRNYVNGLNIISANDGLPVGQMQIGSLEDARDVLSALDQNVDAPWPRQRAVYAIRSLTNPDEVRRHALYGRVGALGLGLIQGASLPGFRVGGGVSFVPESITAEGAGSPWMIGPYREMQMLTEGEGGALQAHHILEERHLLNWGLDASEAPAVILSRQQHTIVTNMLRQELPFGGIYSRQAVWNAYQKVYAEAPDWLDSISVYFNK